MWLLLGLVRPGVQQLDTLVGLLAWPSRSWKVGQTTARSPRSDGPTIYWIHANRRLHTIGDTFAPQPAALEVSPTPERKLSVVARP